MSKFVLEKADSMQQAWPSVIAVPLPSVSGLLSTPQCGTKPCASTIVDQLYRKDTERMATFDPITRRLRQLFAVLDTDEDGFVTWGDYQRIVDKYMTGYALAKSDARIKSLEKAYWAQWLGLLTQANPGQDRLSQDEFVAAQRAAGYDTYASHLLEDIAQAIFNVLDIDRDKRISRDEFARYLAFYEISSTDAAIIFQRLDLDGDAFISQREVARSLRAFHLYNDDLNTPGGIFLGVTERSSDAP